MKEKHISAKPKITLEGITLETMVTELSIYIGWKAMSEKIAINCFKSNPTIKSSLTFLRKTPWARSKVEVMYQFNLNKINKAKTEGKLADNTAVENEVAIVEKKPKPEKKEVLKKFTPNVSETKKEGGLFPSDYFSKKP